MILKLKYIDALRGFAILGVLMVHCNQYGTNIYPALIENIFNKGALGVQLFYIASAFTLFLSLGQRSYKNTISNTEFFIRRYFRIAPMYYLAILYFLYQNGLGPRVSLGDAPFISVSNVISNFLLIHGLSPYWINSVVSGGWSIAIEILFYCCVPFLFSKIKSLNSAVLFFIFTLIIRFVLYFILKKCQIGNNSLFWETYLQMYFPSQLPVFACGIIFYFLIVTPKIEWSINTTLIFGVAILLLIDLLYLKELFFPTHIKFALCFTLLAYSLAQKPFGFLVNSVTTYIGKISYSMYFIHFAVLYYLQKSNFIDLVPTYRNFGLNLLNFGVRYFLLLLITIILATITYRIIEVPFQDLGKKIILKRRIWLDRNSNLTTSGISKK
jgi:peptidoglycan/LPS O-acetylase OafA/YrhL